MKIISKKKMVVLLMSMTLVFISYAQQLIILQPDSDAGKDAYLRSLSPDLNYGNHFDLSAHAWTNSGNEVIVRGIIEFDLSTIPSDAIINSATLSLYSYYSPANGSHSNLTGSNQSTLSRVTSPWEESTVTWNNQPSTTTQNQVFLASSDNSIQDYLNIEVTDLVQDMINDPINSHGFLFKQLTELYYRKMLFASSDHHNSNLHPKLQITFSPVTSVLEDNNPGSELKIFPNPSSNYITIDLSNVNEKVISIDIINSLGQIIERKNNVQSAIGIDVSNYAKGLYQIRTQFNGFVSINKLIIE